MARGKKGDSKRINANERRLMALDLRIAGNSYREIAKQTGVSVKQAWNDINDALLGLADQEQEKTKVLRQLELERLDMLHAAHWANSTTGHDTQAAAVILKIADRRARLLGLDKPAQLDITGQVDSGPNWNALQGVIMAALAAFPDARASVAQALMDYNPIEGELVEGDRDAEF